jgi:site-specific DNA-adenine methylase
MIRQNARGKTLSLRSRKIPVRTSKLFPPYSKTFFSSSFESSDGKEMNYDEEDDDASWMKKIRGPNSIRKPILKSNLTSKNLKSKQRSKLEGRVAERREKARNIKKGRRKIEKNVRF